MQRHKKRQATACSLYSEPSSGDEVPVLTAYNVSWDASCVSLTGYTDSDGQIDLYLSVNYADSSDNADLGIVPVHVWTGIDLDAGSLETTLDQAWWNASDAGAGSVQAQFQIVPSTHELWDTPGEPCSSTETRELELSTGPCTQLARAPCSRLRTTAPIQPLSLRRPNQQSTRARQSRVCRQGEIAMDCRLASSPLLWLCLCSPSLSRSRRT